MPVPLPAFFRHRNNVRTTLGQPATAVEEQLILSTGGGALMPNPGERGAIIGIMNSTDFETAEAAQLAGALEFVRLIELNVDGNPDKIEVERGFHCTAIALDVVGKTYTVFQPVHEFTLDAIGYCMPFGAILADVEGDGATDDAGAILATCEMVPASGGRAHLGPGDYRIASSFTIPANVELHIDKGAKLFFDAAAVMTVHGSIDAGYYQIFSGPAGIAPLSSNVVFQAHVCDMDMVRAAWWGSLPSTSTSDDVTLHTQACWDCVGVNAAAGARIREIRHCSGDHYVKSLKMPDQFQSVAVVGPFRRTCTFRQLSTVAGNNHLVETLGVAPNHQKGPIIRNIDFNGHANGGDCLRIWNVQEALVENCQFTNGATTHAQLRVGGASARSVFRNCRFHCTSATHAKYAMWIGDPDDPDFPDTTNIYFYNMFSYSIGSGEGFSQTGGAVIFLDNAGGCHFIDGKFDGLSAETSVKIDRGLAFRFVNFFFEYTTPCDQDFWLLDTLFVWFERVSMGAGGTPAEKPIALLCDNSYSIRLRACYIQMEINIVGALSEDIKLQDCQLGDNVTWAGDENTAEDFYPRVTIVDSVIVNDNREITGAHYDGPDTIFHLRKMGTGGGASLQADRDLEVDGELSSTGNVVLTGTFDGPHLVLGGVHVFINGNDVRASIGVPSSATDGALVITAT